MSSISKTFQETILPVVFMFIVYDIVGLVGNIVVLYIYKVRYPKNRFRCLVLWLSIIVLTSCCSTVPMETVSTWLWFEAPSRDLCKAKNFLVQFTALSAMFMLFVTAVYKYRQICHPIGKQPTQSVIMISCFCGIVMSLTFATPAAILWNVNNHTLSYDNASEQVDICEVHVRFQGTVYPSLYRHFLSAYSIFLIATIILYIFVAKATDKHYLRMKQRSIPPVDDNPVFSIELSKCEGAENSKNENNTDHNPAPDNVQCNTSSKTKKGKSQLTPRRLGK